MAATQNNLPVLYLYHNLFFMFTENSDYLTHCLQFHLEKLGIFVCLESGDPV